MPQYTQLVIEVSVPRQWAVIYIRPRGHFGSFYDFCIGLWNCSDSVFHFIISNLHVCVYVHETHILFNSN